MRAALAARSVEELEKEIEGVSPPELGSMERCNALLQDLRNNPLAEWFLEPVDHVALGLADYLQVKFPVRMHSEFCPCVHNPLSDHPR